MNLLRGSCLRQLEFAVYKYLCISVFVYISRTFWSSLMISTSWHLNIWKLHLSTWKCQISIKLHVNIVCLQKGPAPSERNLRMPLICPFRWSSSLKLRTISQVNRLSLIKRWCYARMLFPAIVALTRHISHMCDSRCIVSETFRSWGFIFAYFMSEI